MSARDKLRAYFLDHVGEVIDTATLRQVAGISEYARRIRELRDEEGWPILSHKDLATLRPGEYKLESTHRRPAVSRDISLQLRASILERNGYTCQLCGAAAGDPDPVSPGRTVRLHIDHILPASQQGSNDPDNLRVLCSACNAGRANLQPPSETILNVLARIRRLSRDDQHAVFEHLCRTFGPP